MNFARFAPIVANQALLLGLGVVGLKITSLLVDPAVYGRYAIFLTLTQIGVLLTHSGLINLASRHWVQDGERSQTLAHFVWNRSWKALRWLAPCVLLLVVGLYVISRDVQWILVLPLLIIANLALAIAEIGGAALNVSERHWSLLWFRAVATAARVSFPLLLVVAVSGGYLALVAGFSIHGLLMIAITAVVLRPAKADKKADKQARIGDFARWDTALRTYGRPFAALGIGGWLLQNADRWIVERCFGVEAAGQFAMAAGIGGVVPMFLTALLLQAFLPRVFREADAAHSAVDWKKLARKCDYLTLCFLTATFMALGALALAGPALVGSVLAPRYAPAIQILFVSGLAMASVQTNQFQFLLLQGRRDSRAMVRVMIVVAAVKTIGSIASALISWDLYMYWLGVSVLVCAFLGRALVRRAVFSTEQLQTAHAVDVKGEQ
jgi:O-antigen/teichoic acid export membrane protein